MVAADDIDCKFQTKPPRVKQYRVELRLANLAA